MNNDEIKSTGRRTALYVRRGAVAVLTCDDDSAAWLTIEVDPVISTPEKIIEEAVYTSPALLANTGAVDIVVDFDRFVIAPAQSDSEAVAASLWPDDVTTDDNLIIGPITREANFISIADKNLTGFVSRTFGRATLHNRLACLVNFFGSLSRPVNRVKIYAHFVGETGLDIVAFAADGLLMANSFKCQEATDAVYFIMVSAEDCGFDALEDELILCGDSARCADVTDTLRRYLNSVMPLLLPDDNASHPLELLIFKR